MTAHQSRPVVLTACPDGPILVRGDVEIRDGMGPIVPRLRATVALCRCAAVPLCRCAAVPLCRCGASAIKPFYDGSHKAIGFRTEDEVPRPREPRDAAERHSS